MFQELFRLLRCQKGITNLEKSIVGGGLLILFLLFACGVLAPWE